MMHFCLFALLIVCLFVSSSISLSFHTLTLSLSRTLTHARTYSIPQFFSLTHLSLSISLFPFPIQVWGVYPVVIAPPTAGEYNLRDEIDKACEKVVLMGFADPKKDLLTVTAGNIFVSQFILFEFILFKIIRFVNLLSIPISNFVNLSSILISCFFFFPSISGLPFGLKGSTNVVRVVPAAGSDFAFDESSQLKKFVPEK